MKPVALFANIYRSRTFLITTGIAVAIIIAATEGRSQSNAGFLYGKVYTHSTTYEGQIRWGNEEAFWSDYFNAAKLSPDSYKKLVIQEKEKKEETSWLDFDWDLLSIWENKTTVHQFSCQFGDIKQLRVLGRNRARLLFKNGYEMDVDGEGYNDIGGKVQILDNELGWTSINWGSIDRIEFFPIPKDNQSHMGNPLYGTVETERRDKFTGYIHWDNDERLSIDKLDGESRDGKLAIAFSEIMSIEKSGPGSDVTLKSGRSFFMKGSNDVNDGNRGITVIIQGKGMVEVPWESFHKLTFSKMEDSGVPYGTFATPKRLYGTVSTFGGSPISGQIIYDVDETLDMETLEGEDNNLVYTIPFRNIKSIQPKNQDYSIVQLRNGESLLLGDGRDVSAANDGVLVIQKGKKEPVHLRWKTIEQITFD